jgi:cell shape-determining protein MreC
MWAAGSASGASLLGAIYFVVLIVVIVMAITFVVWRFRRPSWRTGRVSWWARRSQRIQEAAAANVAAILEDAKYVRPDAPGTHQDDL